MNPLDQAMTAHAAATDLLETAADAFRNDQFRTFALALKATLGLIGVQLDAIAAAPAPVIPPDESAAVSTLTGQVNALAAQVAALPAPPPDQSAAVAALTAQVNALAAQVAALTPPAPAPAKPAPVAGA